YFVLSSTGPLMQQWFSVTNPGVSPYRLYALSNVGSLLALLSYPVFFEVKFPRHTQAALWSGGLVFFALACGYCAWRVWRRAATPEPQPVAAGGSVPEAPVETAADARVHPVDRLFWFALPAIASILLLATTNKLSQEVAVIPFLWVLPLSLYLVTFIISFDHARWYHRGAFTALLVVSIAFVLQVLPAGTDVPMKVQIAVYSAAMFVACMICHGELYRLKPPPRQLTSYFLSIAAGGALGGFLVAIVAPAVFNDYRELQLGYWLLTYGLGVLCFHHRSRDIAMAVAVGGMLVVFGMPWLQSHFDDSEGFTGELTSFLRGNALIILAGVGVIIGSLFHLRTLSVITGFHPRMAGFVMVFSVLVGAIVVVQWPEGGSVPVLNAQRNFYGTLKVYDYNASDEEERYHLLLHGATTHGLQFVKPERSIIATTYYSETSGVGLALDIMPETPRRVGIVGLGTGSLLVYGRAGDYMRIYEINPAVHELAREQFTYLQNCPASVDVVMGDARLMMERELALQDPQQFDFLALDAFSSDAIPVHLLTKEAFELYLGHLKPDGIIAVHVSNRHLNLRPVVEKAAESLDLHVAVIYEDYEPEWWIYATTWILVTRNREFLDQPVIAEVTEEPETTDRPAPLWTDEYASLYSIMK
ncbi:MAG: fused MFS/spermidine synthase, partial [Opitutus sp.]